MMSALYFDNREMIPYSLGMYEDRMPGLRKHRHLGACHEIADEFIRYWCTECDAFAWKPRP